MTEQDNPESHTDRRGDPETRRIFGQAFDAIADYLDDEGRWLSMVHEQLAYDALHGLFPDLAEGQMFAIVAAATRIRASGNRPAP